MSSIQTALEMDYVPESSHKNMKGPQVPSIEARRLDFPPGRISKGNRVVRPWLQQENGQFGLDSVVCRKRGFFWWGTGPQSYIPMGPALSKPLSLGKCHSWIQFRRKSWASGAFLGSALRSWSLKWMRFLQAVTCHCPKIRLLESYITPTLRHKLKLTLLVKTF